MNEIYLSEIIIGFIYIWILKANFSVQLKIVEGEPIYHFSQVVKLADLRYRIRGNCFDSIWYLCVLGQTRISVPWNTGLRVIRLTSPVCLEVMVDTFFGPSICGRTPAVLYVCLLSVPSLSSRWLDWGKHTAQAKPMRILLPNIWNCGWLIVS